METSLILLKPDCIAKGLVGEVIRRFEEAGFLIRGAKLIKLTPALLEDHYAHLLQKPFFPEIAAFMQSTPVLALALAGDNAIERIRALLGPTDSKKAEKGTIRGDFGTDVMVNIAHASDSPESAEVELKRFFKPEELFTYEKKYAGQA